MNDQERELLERIAGALEEIAHNSEVLEGIQVLVGKIADVLTPPNTSPEPSKVQVNFGEPQKKEK